MADVGAAFAASGLVLAVGVLGHYIFRKTRVSDVLLLVGIGVLLGPAVGWLQASALQPLVPYVVSLALALILFEGGLELDIERLATRATPALALSLISFALTATLVAVLLLVLGEASWQRAALTGSILGAGAGSIALPIASRLKLDTPTKAWLQVESSLGEVWAALSTLAIVGFAASTAPTAPAAAHAVASAFSISAVAGIAFGLLWLLALHRLRGQPFAYMLTLAALLVLYGLMESMRASGPVAALVFGALLANADKVAALFALEGHARIDPAIRRFHGEGAMLVRSFFFVYLGALVSFDTLTPATAGTLALLLFGVALGRSVAVRLADPDPPPSGRALFWAMLPRGLASAVLATLPAAAGLPGMEGLLSEVVCVVLLTNAAFSAWLTWRPPEDPAAPEGLSIPGTAHPLIAGQSSN